ncbi:MAG: hypothetical protein RMI63_08840, partial [Caldimicrobium sp.]|nr:hypothetical protein [Caldimicrobium sp.]
TKAIPLSLQNLSTKGLSFYLSMRGFFLLFLRINSNTSCGHLFEHFLFGVLGLDLKEVSSIYRS